MPPALSFALPESMVETDARAKSLSHVTHRSKLPRDDPGALYLLGLSADSSRVTMLAELRRIARFYGAPLAGFPWAQLTPLHVAALRAFVADTRAPSGANLTMAALRGVTLAAVRAGVLGQAQRGELCDFRPVPGSREIAGRAVTRDELRQLFAHLASKTEPLARRDAAAFSLLYGAGLRRSEASRTDVGSLSARGVQVLGKGNKQRTVPLPPWARTTIDAWLDVRGMSPGALLVPIHTGRSIDLGGRISGGTLYLSVGRAIRRAGLLHFSPHDLRRSYIGDLLDREVDLVTVQHLVGHSDPKQTSRYDRRPERVREEGAAKLPSPFE